jgi:hypothetical protein
MEDLVTNLSSVVAGSRITAAAVQSVAPLSAVKGADQSVTSSTTLVNDSALVLPVVANATYLFACYLDYSGGTGGSSDLKFQWTVPSGTALRFSLIGTDASGTTLTGVTDSDSTVYTLGTAGAATLQAAVMTGSLVMSVTGGSLQLQWAQNTSSGTATKVHAQSSATLWRIT